MIARSFHLLAAALALSLCCTHATAQPVGTSFTYQGKLVDAGGPANGTYDLRFQLFDAQSGGNPIGSINCYDSVAVTDGLVTLTLDFGNAFSSGTERYLEVGVRADTTPGNCATGTYTTLSPRQDVSGAPFAIGLRLPFSASVNSSSDLMTVANSGTGAAITATSNGTWVISGYSVGTGGVGVFGQNNTYGSYGGAGYGSWGIYGFSPVSYGVLGDTSSATSPAIAGINDSLTGLAVGGSFSTQSPNGTALMADASANTGNATGIQGKSYSTLGIGIQGVGASLTGSNYGIYGLTNSTSGTAVFGVANASSGATYAVYGIDNSPQGYAGYFAGRAYISQSVGIGTNAPTVPLDVVGGSDLTLTSGGYVILGDTTSTNMAIDNNEIQVRNNGVAGTLFLNANGGNVGIGTGNAQGFQLAVNGNAAKPGGGSWSTLSDARLKENVQPLTGALDTLLQLRGVTFEYIDPKAINELPGTRTGMIAQEVEKVMPDWVDQGPDGMRRVTFRGFEALTVESLRDLKARQDTQVAEKDAEIARLRSRLDKLESIVATLTSASQSHSAHSEAGAAR